ncbi:hypothetical protein CANARDRAFT_9122 [[Candida] arabinofermentans NRRL YB-2248]|uniref:Uncharacterized protein n=1 Tax=[Candida] arabinofermentans NRRL YB-2248 TaxID=983967 RepID=A0A1E4SWE1_9ASCO|nr:hypothetical protein CANARDRAFT_9122 [[Candida] arabinofermentans NRRL YB-2248]
MSFFKFFSKKQSTEQLKWSEVGQSAEGKVLSPAYIHNGIVYTAGSLGTDPKDPSSIPSTIEEQTHFALQNLETVLKASGASLDSCLKLLVFIKDPADQKRMNAVYSKYMKTQPARSCVVVGFPDQRVLVEIEAVAVQVGQKVKAKL